MKTTARPPVTSDPPVPAPGGPFRIVMAAVFFVLLGMLVSHIVGTGSPTGYARASPRAYPTLTSVPTDTPIVFPDTLIPADTPPETAIAMLTGGTPIAGRVEPVPTVAPSPTSVPTRPRPTTVPLVVPPTATPVPPTPTRAPRLVVPVPTATATYHPGVLVWRYTSPGWVPADGGPVHFTMRKGDGLLGIAQVRGGPIRYQLVTLNPWVSRLYATGIRSPVLIAWTAPEDGDYLLWFLREDPSHPAMVWVDLGIYRP
jgi:hypothetical protein